MFEVNNRVATARSGKLSDDDLQIETPGILFMDTERFPAPPNTEIIGIQAHHGNPYDGHTLTDALSQVERMTGSTVKEAYCDRGYRGHKHTEDTTVHIAGNKRGITRSLRKWLRRRCAIEPIIGHLKSDNRMDRNYLKGKEGDKINALLCGCGANIRKLIAAFFLSFILFAKLREKLLHYLKIVLTMKLKPCYVLS